MPRAMTVHGPVDTADLGRVMPHEHLFSLAPGPWLAGGANDDRVDLAVSALNRLPDLGYGCVVDLSPYGVVGRDDDGHNVTLLREVSERTGLRIVVGCALYLESYAPQWALDCDIDALVRRFVADATTGIGSTGVRAGVYGEQATSLGEITAYEERVLRAMARAHVETGLSIMTHTTHGTMALEQIAILESEGADLDRVVIGHVDTQLSVEVARAILAAGANIAVDTIGKETWDFFLGPPPAQRPDGTFTKQSFARSDAGRADMVAQLVADGFASRILLAQDLTGAEVYMNPQTHGQLGYAYLSERFLPALADRGVDQHAIDTMTMTNPARLLEVAE